MPRNLRTLALALTALTLAAIPGVSLAKHRARGAQAAVQSVGSIASFSGDVLSIEVADGSKLTGRVLDRTRVGCRRGVRGRGHLARAAHRGGAPKPAAAGATGPVGVPERGIGHGRRTCDIASLKVGTKVLAASLVLTADGPVWRLVVFLTPPDPAGATGPTGPTGPITT